MPYVYEFERACVNAQWSMLGLLETNVYVFSDGQGTLVVDPADDADAIMAMLGDRKLDAILLTHFHSDHMGAAAELRERTGAPVIVSAVDAPLVREPFKVGTSPVPLAPACEVDRELEDGDVIKVGNMEWVAMATPGHSKGSMCFFLEAGKGSNPDGMNVLASGDTLFCHTTGRMDLLGGSREDMANSLKRLAELPDNTIVFPGHANLTTIESERGEVFYNWGIQYWGTRPPYDK